MENKLNQNKILFISRTMPVPVKGGDIIVLENIMKALKQSEFQANLLCYIRKNDDIAKISEAKEKFGFKKIFCLKITPKINKKCVFDWFFKGKSYIFNRFYSKKFSKRLLNLVKTGDYSTLVFEHAYMYSNLLFNPVLQEEIKKRNIKTIINAHVLESVVLEQIYKQQIKNPNLCSLLRSIFAKRELTLLKKIEFECIKNADKTIFLSQEDLDRAKNTLSQKAESFHKLEITSFIDDYPYAEPEFEEKNSIYFLGTFSWVQNHDAVIYFVRDIFPLILKQNPQIKLYLVGMNAGKDIKKLHNGKNIFFVGEKNNIFEEIKKYSVLVIPLRIKGGTRIKALESLAWGKAIISTSIGMEGVATYEENHVIIADKPDEFAQKVLELVSDDSLRIKTKESSRNFAEKYFSFEKFTSSIMNIFYC